MRPLKIGDEHFDLAAGNEAADGADGQRKDLGAPVLPVFCPMLADGTYQIDFQPSYGIPEEAVRPGQAHPWVQSYLQTLEDAVRRYPDNSNEYFFWSDSDEFTAPEERAA